MSEQRLFGEFGSLNVNRRRTIRGKISSNTNCRKNQRRSRLLLPPVDSPWLSFSPKRKRLQSLIGLYTIIPLPPHIYDVPVESRSVISVVLTYNTNPNCISPIPFRVRVLWSDTFAGHPPRADNRRSLHLVITHWS